MNHRERAALKRTTNERHANMMEAARDERARFNAALAAGKTATLETAFGPHEVTAVDDNFWYTTYPAGRGRDQFSRRSFAGCNDGSWDGLLEQVGEDRNDFFRKERLPW